MARNTASCRLSRAYELLSRARGRMLHARERLSLLRFRDWLDLACLWACLQYARARLALLPRRANRAWLAGDPGCPGGTDGSEGSLPPASRLEARIARQLELLSLAARLSGPDATCLRRSLALRARLSAWGIRATLVYGSRRGPAGIEAHAWVRVGPRDLDSYGTSVLFRPFAVARPGRGLSASGDA